MSKYTEGKWFTNVVHEMEVDNGVISMCTQISHYGVGCHYNDEKLRRCTVIIASCYLTAGREDEARANASLIAAAPDLLAVAQLAEVAFKNRDQTEGEANILAAIKLAIAKATAG